MRQSTNPDFIEALARGLDVLRVFDAHHPTLSLSEVAQLTGLMRPTVRRILITLTELGYVQSDEGRFSLTPRVFELGTAYISSTGIWDLVRPHLRLLVTQTNQSCSIAQLDGSDVVYVSRVAVPKLVSLAVSVGTRFPAAQTSLGKVLLSSLEPDEVKNVLSIPSRSDVVATWQPDIEELLSVLREVRAQGWAVTDQQLAPAIRSIAAPVRNGSGKVVAAINVNTHALETTMEVLTEEYLPLLLKTASAISADWARWEALPFEERSTTPV